MPKLYRQSPLKSRKNDMPVLLKRDELSVMEEPFIQKYTVIGQAPKVKGLTLPENPNEFSEEGGMMQCLWVSPKEWLLLGSDEGLLSGIRQAAANQSFHMIDVTDKYQTFEVKGLNAAALLATGCSLDLRGKSFSDGKCAQSRIGQVPIILYRQKNSIFVMVERPLTQYLWVWFEQTIKEFIR